MTWERRKREGPGRPEELEGGFTRINISIGKAMKERLEKKLGGRNTSKFIRNLINPAMEELDPEGEKLCPEIKGFDWLRIADRQFALEYNCLV